MSDDFPVTIYHSPDCGTSRNVVAMVRAAGYEPAIVEYLKVGWDRMLLEAIVADIPATPRELLREKATSAAQLDLLKPGVPDEEIIAAMIAYPILVNRPIVATPLGVKLCRPSELVLELLERKPTAFTKENGEVLIPGPAKG
ncbi:MAG TPA: arsenate reductase family protein [Caulobacteraceae bacterium]|nr:arsenate reductase family protein [Caulobacteraceae bacterium]